MNQLISMAGIWLLTFACGVSALAQSNTDMTATRSQADRWRTEHRLIDLHQHIDYAEGPMTRAVHIMDAAGIGLGVNLSGGTVTHKDRKKSEFEIHRDLANKLFPGRFVHYMNLDYTDWNEPDFAERAAHQVEEGHRLGAAGFKEYKQLGLFLRDKEGKLIQVDDPKLDPVWQRCGELGMPVSIHVADPKSFWRPFDATNERWEELKDHKNWWFGDPKVYPPWEDLLAALNRVIQRHPKTTFVCVHFGNNAEDIEMVDRWLDKYPNMMVDLAARIPEIGRQDAEKVRQVFIKHQDRILFGTDFMVYDKLTLGSGGSGPAPADADAQVFFEKHWRWMETRDRGFAHMTPIQGSWTIDAIGLPAPVLQKIYFDNARKLLVQSLPLPTVKAVHIPTDFAVDGSLSNPAWKLAQPVFIEHETVTGAFKPELSTSVRLLWSDQYLYIGYSAPFTKLAVFEPPFFDKERAGLWDKDVVEAFIGGDLRIDHYREFQVAPTGEKLDLAIGPSESGLTWNSGFLAAVKVNQQSKTWTSEMRIPLTAISAEKTAKGTHWRINLLRCERDHKAFLAWSPSGSGTFHVPGRFGVLEFVE